MKILIWGAGAIGGTIGAHLIRTGHDVTFVDRVAEHVAAINEKGLAITGPIAEFCLSAQAYVPSELTGTFETILLCVKAQDSESVARALTPHLQPNGYVVSVQNGLNELVISEVVGRERTVGSFVNFGADYLEPGVILFGGRGAVVLGELDGQITPRLRALHQAFLDFDANAITTSNIWGYLWGKLAYGAQLFATALCNDSIADALDHPAYRQLYIDLAQEVLRVAQAQGVTPEAFNGFDPRAFVPGADPAISQRSLDEMVAHNRRSAKSHSGVWRDLAIRKRRTEVDAIIGPVVTFGRKYGVPTPLSARLIELIHDVEESRQTQGLALLDQLQRAGQ